MTPWAALVEIIAAGIESVGEALGGRALGILASVFIVRVALIPLLLPLGLRIRARQRVVRRIRPRIKALDRELRDHPGELSRQLKALHAEHGITMVDWPGLAGALVQLPLLIALFQAVLLVWSAEAMTASGLGLGVVAGGLSLVGTKLSGQGDSRGMLWLSAVLPVAVCVWLGPGVGLYLIGFYAAAALQGMLMARRAETLSLAEP